MSRKSRVEEENYSVSSNFLHVWFENLLSFKSMVVGIALCLDTGAYICRSGNAIFNAPLMFVSTLTNIILISFVFIQMDEYFVKSLP